MYFELTIYKKKHDFLLNLFQLLYHVYYEYYVIIYTKIVNKSRFECREEVGNGREIEVST